MAIKSPQVNTNQRKSTRKTTLNSKTHKSTQKNINKKTIFTIDHEQSVSSYDFFPSADGPTFARLARPPKRLTGRCPRGCRDRTSDRREPLTSYSS